MMVLGKSNFGFRYRSIIQFLPLWSMDDKAEAEPKTVLAKYYQSRNSIQIRTDQFDASNALKKIAQSARKFNAAAPEQRQDGFENTEIYCYHGSSFSGQYRTTKCIPLLELTVFIVLQIEVPKRNCHLPSDSLRRCRYPEFVR